MTERNILLLKSAMSAAKSMSPLRHKYEEAFQEIHYATKETNMVKLHLMRTMREPSRCKSANL